MKYLYSLSLGLIFLSGCQMQTEWTSTGKIDLGDVTPIGLCEQDGNLWITDGDHNQVVIIDKSGKVLDVMDNFDRPMHLSASNGSVYIPEYGSDRILEIKDGLRTTMEIKDSLDAPAGIDVLGSEIAIADFYNHRILYFNGTDWISIGKEGKALGEFYYPTDVAIGIEHIFVADAYNNRIQVLDKQGKALKFIGETEKMNAATGIYASKDQVFITDFEKNRVLVYNHDGQLEQSIVANIHKPTDILIADEVLYIAKL